MQNWGFNNGHGLISQLVNECQRQPFCPLSDHNSQQGRLLLHQIKIGIRRIVGRTLRTLGSLLLAVVPGFLQASNINTSDLPLQHLCMTEKNESPLSPLVTCASKLGAVCRWICCQCPSLLGPLYICHRCRRDVP